MNFYKHHIGDYAKKTAHLSVAEHGAYLLMLHAYYGTENPLPKGEVLYRMIRAVTKAERAAVDSVARQFWSETDAGWVNGRAFSEIELATEQGNASRQNGKLGGRPKITQQVFKSEPRDNLLQTPDSTIQSKNPLSPSEGKAKRKAPKTRLPEDFALTPELEQYAIDHLPSVNPLELFASFRGKAEAKGWEYVNWRQAFQEFIRNAAPNSGHFAAGQYPKKSSVSNDLWSRVS